MGAKVSLSGESSRKADDNFSGKTIHRGQVDLSPTVTEAILNSPLYVLIHNNSIDKYGRNVCKRASKINSFLLQKGMRTSFGNYEEKNLGSIPNTMNNRPTTNNNNSNGVVNNAMSSYNNVLDEEPNVVFIIFLTEQYLGTLLTQVGKYYDDVKLDDSDELGLGSDDKHSKHNKHNKHNKQFRYLDTTIRNLIQRYHSGTCRIIPVVMEEDSLEASRFYDYNLNSTNNRSGSGSGTRVRGGFDSMGTQINPLDTSDIAVKFVWTIDYSGDDSFPLVTRQLLQVMSSWKAQDILTISKRNIGNIYSSTSGNNNTNNTNNTNRFSQYESQSQSQSPEAEAVEYNIPLELATFPPGVSPYEMKYNGYNDNNEYNGNI